MFAEGEVPAHVKHSAEDRAQWTLSCCTDSAMLAESWNGTSLVSIAQKWLGMVYNAIPD